MAGTERQEVRDLLNELAARLRTLGIDPSIINRQVGFGPQQITISRDDDGVSEKSDTMSPLNVGPERAFWALLAIWAILGLWVLILLLV